MSKGLEELKRLAYENACCRCQYYINNQCVNNNECVWKTIGKDLKALEIIKEIAENDFLGKLNANSRYILKTIFDNLPKEKQDLLKEVLK